jgi:nicotinamidase-related amidase
MGGENMKIGLLIIDMQNVFLRGFKNKGALEDMTGYINYVADLLRSNGHCIVLVQDVEGADDPDSELFDVIPEIQVGEQDIRIRKEASNAFWDTKLQEILIENEVDLVIVSGFAAEHCVLFTYNGAIERGFQAVMLQHGILSLHDEAVQSTYQYRNVISHPVVEWLMSSSRS